MTSLRILISAQSRSLITALVFIRFDHIYGQASPTCNNARERSAWSNSLSSNTGEGRGEQIEGEAEDRPKCKTGDKNWEVAIISRDHKYSNIARASGYKTVDHAKIILVNRYLTFLLFLY